MRLVSFSLFPYQVLWGTGRNSYLKQVLQVDGPRNSWLSLSLKIETNYIFFYSFWKSNLQNCVILFMCLDSEQKLLLLKVAVLQKKTFPAQTGVLVCGLGNCFTGCVFKRSCLQQFVGEVTETVVSRYFLSSLLHFAEHTIEKDAGQVSIFPHMNLKISTLIMYTQFYCFPYFK